MDARIPYEQSFVVEATVKSRWPDRTWPHAGLSPRQKEHRPDVERDVQRGRNVVADYVAPTQEAGTSTLLGFVSWIGEAVSMVYVKRDFRGYGLGALLLGGAGVKGDQVVKGALPLRANRCWQRWVAYHGSGA
jgi:GNAT superfamily N-acetyltransferase